MAAGPTKRSRFRRGNLTSVSKQLIKRAEKEPVMFGREFLRSVIAALDAASGEGSFFSPVIKTRSTKTTTKTV